MSLRSERASRAAVILAAGTGTRLQAQAVSKCLVEVSGRPLLLWILEAVRDAGFERAVLVLGDRSEEVRATLRSLPQPLPLPLRTVVAADARLGNGATARAAEQGLESDDASFALLMGDHLIGAEHLRRVLRRARSCAGAAVLGTAPVDAEQIDLDDATKVALDDGGRITAINKQLEHYDGIDTGVFVYDREIFACLAAAAKEGQHALTAGNALLASRGLLYAAPVGRLRWQDVDTPQDLAAAERAVVEIFSHGPSMSVAGARVDDIDLPELLAAFDETIDRGERRTISYLNVHVANEAHLDPRLAVALYRADHVYCDGAGVRLATQLLGLRPPPRMTGADLIWDVAAHLALRERRLYWLGGEPGVAAATLAALQRRHPQLVVAGSHHGYFDDTDDERLLDTIAQARPDVLVLGLGTPRQELWVHEHRHRLEVPIVWNLGATGDFVVGRKSRAPRWMRENSLEWLHRLLSEPRRLGARYLLGNPLFAYRVARQRWGQPTP